jgi:prepilin-type processing-associated H-X9-DG protein
MGITGLLAALLVPAVQQARATARRVQCTNHLKQIGIAVHNCVSSLGVFPTKSHSGWKDIFRAAESPEETLSTSSTGSPLFRCPEDSYSGLPETGRSYPMNSGTLFRKIDDSRVDGFLSYDANRRPSDFTDGQSQTAAFSERLVEVQDVAVPGSTIEPDRYLWWTSHEVPQTPGNEKEFIRVCQTERTSQTPVRLWLAVEAGIHGYDHRLPPNQFGCWNGPSDVAYRHEAIAPASSQHVGGVNVLFVDGHVQFVANAIDAEVWRAVGSINGHETIDGSIFQ